MNTETAIKACKYYDLDSDQVIIFFFDAINYYYERREPLPIWIADGQNWKTIPNLYFMDRTPILEKAMIDEEERRINDPFGNALDFWEHVVVHDGYNNRGELLDWLAKNTNGPWTRKHPSPNGKETDEYYFDDPNDAMRFKLIWG